MPFKYAGPVERIAAHSIVDRAGCWIWTGSRNNVGRPRIAVRLPGKTRAQWITVARYIVQFVHGRRWGRNESRRRAGCHSCDVGDCVNPDHVTGGTQKKNVRDAVARGRHRHTDNFSKWNTHRRNCALCAAGVRCGT